MSKTVGIVSKLHPSKVLSFVDIVVKHVLSRGLSVILESKLAHIKKMPQFSCSINQMNVDFIITIGGDGTILKTCLSMLKPETPILTINMGRRGFLTEVTPVEALTAIDKYLNGDYFLEKCMKISTTIDGLRMPDALNEVLFASKTPSKLINLNIIKNQTQLAYVVDGLIISTPTGSTAYSLSAGGSVIDPKLEAFILTPINSMIPSTSIVFSPNDTIEVKLKEPSKALLVIDGQERIKISKKNVIKANKSEHQAVFIRFKDGFYSRLRKRLSISP